MTPRPVIRWKSFWFGILVLGFLGWAWARSMNRLDIVRFDLGVDGWEVVSTTGKTSVVRYAEVITGGGIRDIRFSTEAGGGSNRELKPAFERFEFDERETMVAWMFAYWFLILLFLVPWSAWLFWHWKRERKKAAP